MSPRNRILVVGLLVLAGLLLSVVAGGLVAGEERSQRQATFETDAALLGAAVESEARALFGRVRDFGAFAASGPPTRSEFAHYVEQTEITDSPLLQGVAYIESVPREKEAAFLARERADDPDFALRSLGRPERGPLAVLIRATGAPAILGLELSGLSSDAVSVLGASQSAGPVLVQVPTPTRPLISASGLDARFVDGVFLSVPVRTPDGAIAGWAAAEVTPENLLDQLVPSEGIGAEVSIPLVDPLGRERRLLVATDGESASERPAADDAQRSEFQTLDGRTWEVTVWSGSGPSSSLALVVFVGGLLLTILAALGVHSRLSAAAVEGRLDESERRLRLDTLTGLPNRLGLEETLGRLLSRWRDTSAAALFVDVDRFKLINDSLGHAAGDELLVAVADRLRATLPEGDIVGRFGGDEFLIVTGDLDDPSAGRDRARQVLDAFSEPLALSFGKTRVHASVGLRLIEPLEVDPGAVVRDADLAMFEAKRRGGAQFGMFGREMRDAVDHRLALERALSDAVPAGDLELMFQPIVDAHGEISAVEGLLRWDHPDMGGISPEEFLLVAEEIGLMHDISRQVVRAAIDAAAGWGTTTGTSIQVAVNVSASELRDTTFPEFVREALAEGGLAPGRLVLEISEELLLDSNGPVFGVLAELREVGVGLSIDDFGTGRSSLGQAGRLAEVTEFKLDRSLVAGVDQPEGRLIVKAAAELAAGLGQRVVAEGVERPEQRDFLIYLGINRFQGFLFAPAVSAARIAEWLEEGGHIDMPESVLLAPPPSAEIAQPSS